MKLLTLNSNKFTSSYDQPSDDLIKWRLLKLPETFPCIKIHQASIIHDPRSQHLLQIQKWWDAILSAFCQYLSTNKIWPPYKSLRVEYYKISSFLLPLDTHPKYSTAK